MDEKDGSLEQKYNELQEFCDSISKKYEAVSKENEQLKKEKSAAVQNTHSGDFWQDVEDKCISDPDYIKGLIKNKILTVHDMDTLNRTLLIIAAENGSYELVQFCINSGADINAKDRRGRTALAFARQSGYYHVEQLLLFSQMNVNIGNEIKNTADTIHKQNGINYNILNELKLIGKQSKELFEKILMELMINIITKKLSFSDNLLNLCWNIASRKNTPLSSDLWEAISSTCSDIIQNGTKRDWYWLKSCVIPSTLWFKDISTQKKEEKSQDKEQERPHYLYYELLKLVDIEAKNQLNKLEQDLNKLANQNKKNWDKLTKWDLADQYEKVRQDVIPNGIVSRYTYNQLSESSGATFNSPKFYDYNQYLSQLVLLAQIVDDEFQRSVQDMFKIDKVTNEGIVAFNNNMYNIDDEKQMNGDVGDGKIKYMRGPVKLIERARNKAQNDYANEEYPASACVLDLNRCALIFNDISTLLTSLELFVNKVKYYQSGNIIGVVRDKNGFIEYIKQTQYADIKLNVLIKGKHNNLIGEIQFLLKTMKEFKDKAHNLYAIQRQKESIESSVTKILPMLLDEDKQLFIAGNRGNVKRLCELMVINNKSIDDIMKTDKETGNTILHRICTQGHDKAFSFLKSIISKQAFIKYVLAPNVSDQRPAEYSIRYGQVSIAKKLFDMKEIKENYQKKNELFRLCYFLFIDNKNGDLTDYILKLLNIKNNDVIEMMNYDYIKTGKEGSNAIPFDRDTVIRRIATESTLNQLLKLVSVIGEKAFIKNALIDDDWCYNGIEAAINKNKIKMVEYMLSFKEIKNKYINNDKLLFRLIFHLFVGSGNENMIKYILSELQISNNKIQQLLIYQFPSPSRRFGSGSYKYQYYSITAMIVNMGTFDSFKYLFGLIGEKGFYDVVFWKDGWNKNALQRGIEQNRLEFVKYMMNIKEIRNKCVDDQDELYSILSTLNGHFNQSMASYIINILDLTEAKLNELKAYRNIDLTKILSINN